MRKQLKVSMLKSAADIMDQTEESWTNTYVDKLCTFGVEGISCNTGTSMYIYTYVCELFLCWAYMYCMTRKTQLKRIGDSMDNDLCGCSTNLKRLKVDMDDV